MAVTFLEANIKDLTGETYQTDISVKSWNLTSLKGFPSVVNGNCDMSLNNLKTLKFCAEKIMGYFTCRGNKLPSLLGAPKYIMGHFDATSNDIRDLKGFPLEVGGNVLLNMNYGLKKSYILDYIIDNDIKIGGKIMFENVDIKPEYDEIIKDKNSLKRMGKFKDLLDL